MARVSKVEACMLCEHMPCECNKKRGSKTATSRSSWQEGKNKSVALSSAPLSPARRSLPEEQLVFVAALRVLTPILHPSELERYEHLLAAPKTIKERAAFWKAKREG